MSFTGGSLALGSAAGLIKIGYDDAGVRAAMRDMDALGARGRTLAADLNTVGVGLAGIATAGVVGLGKALTSAAAFNKQISAIASVGGKDAVARIDEIRDSALQLGADTAFSADEAAAAMEELVKAGLPVGDVMDGVARASLDLAAATGAAVPAVSNQIGQMLNVFGDSMVGFTTQAEQATRVADILAQTANASATDVGEIGYAMASAGNVADTFGITMEDTAAAIGLMANAGVVGSDAGTSLRNMLSQMLKPTKDQAAAMAQLGLDFFDAQGQFIGLNGVVAELNTALAGLSQEEQLTALQTLFMNDGFRAAKVLWEENVAGIDAFQVAMTEAGTVQEQAVARFDNFAGDVEKLSGSLDSLVKRIGLFLETAGRPFVQWATGAVNSIAALPEPVLFAATAVAAATTAVAAVGGAAALAGPRIVEFAGALRNVLSLSRLAGVAFGPVGLGLAAIGVAVVAYQKNILGFGDAVDRVFGGVADVVGEAVKLFGRMNAKGFNPLLAGAKALARGLNRTFGQNPITRFIRDSIRQVQEFAAEAGRLADVFGNFFDLFSDWGFTGLEAGVLALASTIDSAFGRQTALGDFLRNALVTGQRFAAFVRGDVLPAVQAIGRYFAAAAEDGDAWNDWIGDVPAALQPAVRFLGELVATVRDVVDGFRTSGVQGAVDAFVGKLGGIGVAAGDLLGQIGGLALQAVQAIGAALLDGLRQVDWAGLRAEVAAGLGVAWGWVRDNAPGLAADALAWLRGAVDRVDWGSVWTAIADALGEAASGAKDWLLTVGAPALGGFLADNGRPLVEWIGNRIGDAVALVGGNLGIVKDWLLNVAAPTAVAWLGGAIDLAGRVKDWIVGQLIGETSAPDAGNDFTPARGRGLLIAFPDWLLEVGVPAAENAISWAAGALETVKTTVGDLIDGIAATAFTFDAWKLTVAAPGKDAVTIDFQGVIDAIKAAWTIDEATAAKASQVGAAAGAALGELVAAGLGAGLAAAMGGGGATAPGGRTRQTWAGANAAAQAAGLNLGDAFANFDTAFTDAFKKAVGPEFEQVGAALDLWIREQVRNLWVEIFKGLFGEGNVEMIRAAGRGEQPSGEDIWRNAWDFAMRSLESIVGPFPEIPVESAAAAGIEDADTRGMGSTLGAAMGNQLATALSSEEFKAALEGQVASAGGEVTVGSALGNNLVEDFGAALGGAAPQATSLGTALSGAIATAVTVATTAFEAAGSGLGSKLVLAFGALLRTTEGGGVVLGLAPSLKNAVTNAGANADVLTATRDAGAGLGGVLVGTFGDALGGVTGGGTGEMVGGLSPELTTAIQGAKTKATAAFQEVGGALGGALLGGVDKALKGQGPGSAPIPVPVGLTGVVETALGEALTIARGYAVQFKQAGAALGQGLADGMTAVLPAVEGAARELAAATKETIDKEAEIGSPSRVAIRQGRAIGQGHVIGLRAEVANVAAAARDLAAVLLGAAPVGWAAPVLAPAVAGGARLAESRVSERQWAAASVSRMAADTAARAGRDGGWRGPSHVETKLVLRDETLRERVLDIVLVPLMDGPDRAPMGRGA